MQELIERLTAKTGLEPALAEKSVGIILGFLKKEGPSDAVATMMEGLPGADDLVAAHAGGGGGGGLGGMLGGLMGKAGGVMALGTQLMGAGLNMGQIQSVGRELFAFGREKVGEDTMGEIVGAVPGLSQFV